MSDIGRFDNMCKSSGAILGLLLFEPLPAGISGINACLPHVRLPIIFFLFLPFVFALFASLLATVSSATTASSNASCSLETAPTIPVVLGHDEFASVPKDKISLNAVESVTWYKVPL